MEKSGKNKNKAIQVILRAKPTKNFSNTLKLD